MTDYTITWTDERATVLQVSKVTAADLAACIDSLPIILDQWPDEAVQAKMVTIEIDDTELG